MFWTVVALVMTVLMGGIIAYNGDLIGRKFGKRRLSLFGMRPKHTAILITSVTGVLISAITTAVLFLIVPPVRRVILEGEEALRTNRALKREIRGLEVARSEAILQAEQARQEKQGAVEENRRVQEQLQSTAGELDAAKKRLQTIQKEIRQEQRRAKQLEARNAQLEARNRTLHGLNARLARVNANLVKQNQQLTARNLELVQQIQTKEEQNNRLDQENLTIARQNEELLREQDRIVRVSQRLSSDLLDRSEELAAKNEVLVRQNAQLMEDVKALSEKNRQITQQSARAVEESRLLAQRIRTLEEKIGELEKVNTMLRTRRVVIHGGEDLGRKVVPAEAPPDVVRQSIRELLHEAHLAALAKGAGTGEQARAVRVVGKQESSLEGTTFEVSEDDRVEAIVHRLAWSPEPVCVLALAVSNCVEQETAAIDFQRLPNPLIYKKGYLIAERRLDTTQPPDQIFSELVEMLKGLGQSALNRGMIPRIDPATGHPQIGALSGTELVKLLDRARTAGRLVRIQARAAEETHAADTLQLDFRIDAIL